MSGNGQHYKPKPEDIIWAEYVLSIIAHRGILGYPDTQLTYRVDKIRRVLRLLNPEVLSDTASLITHRRTRIVFAALGYRVLLAKK